MIFSRHSARYAVLLVLAPLGFALVGCSLSDEPIPLGPIETDTLPVGLPPDEDTAPQENVRPIEAPSNMGTVQGQVFNATTGSNAPAGIEVELYGPTFDNAGDIQESVTLTTTTEEDGTFRFDDMPMDDPNLAYAVYVVYDGVAFGGWAPVDPANPTLDLPITIYENTTDPSIITVDALHLVIHEHPDALLVFQLYVFSNQSNRVFVSDTLPGSDQRGSVVIRVPSDAYNLDFEEGEIGERFVPVENLLYDTDPVPPGERANTVILTYSLPTTGAREVIIPVDYQTSQVNVLVQDSLRVHSQQLSAAGEETIAEQTYDKYVGQNLAPGDMLTFSVQAATPPGLVIALVGGVLAISIGGGGYWYIRRRSLRGKPGEMSLLTHQRALVRQIAELDEAFEEGRVNRFEYEARRADLKATLAEELQSSQRER